MNARTRRSRSLKSLPLAALAAIVLAGCPGETYEPPGDGEKEAAEIAVITTSAEFRQAAQTFQEPCQIEAEFGRCGCTLDGFTAPCELVAWCLEVGFCEPASADPGTQVTTESEAYRTAARNLQRICRLPAEFGRCNCTLDGIETSCDWVQRCLRLGFCVATAG